MTNSGPSTSTIKRLFALSGNRCAFPKCPAPMAIGESPVGEICHIRGRRPGAARYDGSIPTDELHNFNNLMLLCATHHKVIDDDEGSYTADKLRSIKIDHEETATRISEDEAERVAKTYSIVNFAQSGGIAANNFIVDTVTVNAARPSDTVLKRQLEAIQNLWKDILALEEVFQRLISIDIILTSKEIDDYFRIDFKKCFHGRCVRVPRSLNGIQEDEGS